MILPGIDGIVAVNAGGQMLRSFPLPHLGQVRPAERPDPVRSSFDPAIVPVQLPLAQKAHPHRSQRVLSGGPADPRPHPGHWAIFALPFLPHRHERGHAMH